MQYEVNVMAIGISENTTSYFITNKLDFSQVKRNMFSHK